MEKAEIGMREFDYTVETPKSFEAAVAAVEDRSAQKGFKVLCVHDVQATLASKGISREPLKIVEICNATYVSRVLAKDIKISLMLPCPISVYVEKEKVFISALRPRVIADFYPDAGIDDLAEEVDGIILSIVDAAR